MRTTLEPIHFEQETLNNIDKVLANNDTPTNVVQELPAPPFKPNQNNPVKNVALMVAQMKRHMADAGWQLTKGLEYNGYELFGHGLNKSQTDIPEIVCVNNPTTLVLQDKREWDIEPRRTEFLDPNLRFYGAEYLKLREDIFKLTVVKDSHQRPWYHSESAAEIGCHAWIIYYHPRIVKHLASYVRPQHLIRTTHSVDCQNMPAVTYDRKKTCLFSGATGMPHYPLRNKIKEKFHLLPENTFRLEHPGYHARGCVTPKYLQVLSEYKVSICTSSRYGYTLRKIIEGLCSGCIVITDLPVDDPLPFGDQYLFRIPSDIKITLLSDIIRRCARSYDPAFYGAVAKEARHYYDYRNVVGRLVGDIENLRSKYND